MVSLSCSYAAHFHHIAAYNASSFCRISTEHSPKLQIRSHSYLRAVSEVSINRSLDSLDPAGLLASPKFRSRNESYMRAMSTISQVSRGSCSSSALTFSFNANKVVRERRKSSHRVRNNNQVTIRPLKPPPSLLISVFSGAQMINSLTRAAHSPSLTLYFLLFQHNLGIKMHFAYVF